MHKREWYSSDQSYHNAIRNSQGARKSGAPAAQSRFDKQRHAAAQPQTDRDRMFEMQMQIIRLTQRIEMLEARALENP